MKIKGKEKKPPNRNPNTAAPNDVMTNSCQGSHAPLADRLSIARPLPTKDSAPKKRIIAVVKSVMPMTPMEPDCALIRENPQRMEKKATGA